MAVIPKTSSTIEITDNKLYICDLCSRVWSENNVKISTILNQETQNNKADNADYKRITFDENPIVICNNCLLDSGLIGVKLTPANVPQSPSESS